MFPIRVPDDTANKLTETSNSQGRSVGDYLAETGEQDVSTDEPNCSPKEAARARRWLSRTWPARL